MPLFCKTVQVRLLVLTHYIQKAGQQSAHINYRERETDKGSAGQASCYNKMENQAEFEWGNKKYHTKFFQIFQIGKYTSPAIATL